MVGRKSLVAGLATLALGSFAFAAPLNLTLDTAPDITSGFLDVVYDAGIDAFSIDGYALSLFDGAGTSDITNGSFGLAAQIDDSGALGGVGNTLTITGQVLGFGTVNPLLTADLTDFGYLDPPGGDIFEFVFTVTGGDLATPSYYGSPGSAGGLILNANGSGFAGAFDVSFDNLMIGMPGTGNGTCDTGVPEPASLLMLVLVGSFSFRRRV